MNSSKTINVLRSLSRKELRKFSEYTASPFFNKNEKITAVLNELVKYYPKFSSKNFTEENVFKKVFPGMEFDYFKLRNLLSDIYQLARSFLKYTAYERKQLHSEIDLLTELHERSLNVPYSQTEKSVTLAISKLKVKDENYYFLQFMLNRINTSHYKFEGSKYTFNSIQKEFDIFLQYSLTGLLKHYSKMLHNRNHGNINFNMEMLEPIMEYIKTKDFRESPSCRIYKQIILLELNRDEKDYRILWKLKKDLEKSISVEDMFYILLVLNSFAVYRLKLGDETYYKDRFLVFKEISDRNFFPEETIFPNFINTFTSACMAGELKWAEDYIRKFGNGIVPRKEKESTLNYCKGFLAYSRKEYLKALELFAQTNFKLFLFKVMVKSYMLRIYYEEGMHEQALNAVDSFRHYLKSEKLISEVQKNAHYEFLTFITTLAKLKLEGNRSQSLPSLSLLKKQVAAMRNNSMGIKNWLLRKIDEFK